MNLDPITEKAGPKSRWRQAYDRFLRIRGNPHEIALGLAVGVIVGFTPFMGFHMALAVFFAMLLKCNKIAAASVVWFSNPMTAPVVYGFTYWVGNLCMGGYAYASVVEKLKNGGPTEWIHAVPDILWPLIIGGLVVSIPVAVIGYIVTLRSVTRFQAALKVVRVHPLERQAVPASASRENRETRSPENEPNDEHQNSCITISRPERVDKSAQPGCAPPV